MISDSNLINEYKQYLFDDNEICENSIELYINDTKKLIKFIQILKKDIKQLDLECFSEFKKYLVFHNYSQSTVKRIMYSNRKFVAFLHENKMLKCNFADKIKVEISMPRQPQKLKSEELYKILEQINLLNINSMRDDVFFRILAGSELDLDEALDLKAENIIIQQSLITYNNKSFFVSDGLNKRISDYISRMRLITSNHNGDMLLFQSGFGEKLTRQGMLKNLKKYAKKAGIEQNISLRSIKSIEIVK